MKSCRQAVVATDAACLLYLLSLLSMLSLRAAAADHTESSIEVSGRVVAGLDYTSNVEASAGGVRAFLRGASNQWGTSRLTVMAQRHVDAQWAALALLEAGFGADQGRTSDTSLWSRRALVSLRNEQWGQLRVGKNLSVSNEVWDIDPMGQNWSGSATLVGGRNWQVAPAAVGYTSAAWRGMTATVQIAPGGEGGLRSAGSRQGLDFAMQHDAGVVHLIYDEAICARQRSVCTGGRMDNVYVASREWIAGGTYKWQAVTGFLGLNLLKAPDADKSTQPTWAGQAWVGVQHRLSPQLLLRGAIYLGRTDQAKPSLPFDGAKPYGGGSGRLMVLGSDYALDPGLVLWTTLARMHNGSNARYSSGNYWDTVPPAGQPQSTVNVGVAFQF